MAVVLCDRTIVASNRDAETVAVRFNFDRLRDVEEEILVHLDDVIHLRSFLKSALDVVYETRLLKILSSNQCLYSLEAILSASTADWPGAYAGF